MKTVVTITGPSGSGKSTLEEMLVKRGFAKVISDTTRPPRTGEQDGVHYYFRTHADFQTFVELGEFVETAEFNGHRYGASVNEFKKAFIQNKPVVVVVEPNGREQIRAYCQKHGWKLITVYLDNPTEVIAERLVSRLALDIAAGKKDPYAALVKRLASALGQEAFWRIEAMQDIRNEVYNLKFLRFDAETDKMAVALIGAMAMTHVTGESTSELIANSLRAAYAYDMQKLQEARDAQRG